MNLNSTLYITAWLNHTVDGELRHLLLIYREEIAKFSDPSLNNSHYVSVYLL